MPPIRVLVVDDHEVARRGIRSVLCSDASLDVVWEAADGEEAVRRAAEFHPAIILLDITLPGMSGIQAAGRIRIVSPDSRIIFLSQHDSVQIAKDALSVGPKVTSSNQTPDVTSCPRSKPFTRAGNLLAGRWSRGGGLERSHEHGKARMPCL